MFLKINGIEKEDMELSLTDQDRKIYKSIKLTCENGENNFSINIQDLPKGLYYINLSGRNKQSLKFFKM